MRLLLLLVLFCLLSGCSQQFTGSVYKVQVGRQITSFFDDVDTTWQASAEFKFGR